MMIHTRNWRWMLALCLFFGVVSCFNNNKIIYVQNGNRPCVQTNGLPTGRRYNAARCRLVADDVVVVGIDEQISATDSPQLQKRTARGEPPPKTTTTMTTAIDQVIESYGMPWKTSIDPSYDHDFLFYMPFWEWQIAFMKEHLTNLRHVPTQNRQGTNDLTYVENNHNNDDHKDTAVTNKKTKTKTKKRMITLCFQSDEYRLIRMTLLDAGTATQVFTSLWYPNANLPVLGIDLLQFNHAKRHLTVVDFQPIHPTEQDHDVKYEHLLRPIRSAYPSLQHKMSKRFYDENQFFSNEMLMGRGNSTDYVWVELMPAYKEYTQMHVDLTKANLIRPSNDVDNDDDEDNDGMNHVLQFQKAYDDYSSVRDPAHGLLGNIFGKEYADEFVFDVLFPLSDGISAMSTTD